MTPEPTHWCPACGDTFARYGRCTACDEKIPLPHIPVHLDLLFRFIALFCLDWNKRHSGRTRRRFVVEEL